tara:strand:- start:389 stop:1111 length:723 start_codon:yes stop_codon:yes gene_type:complete
MSAEESPKRILLKMSGEALMGGQAFGIDPDILDRLAYDLKEIVENNIQVGLVIGGGNIYRGSTLVDQGLNRVRGDQIGMLATIMNSLCMEDWLSKKGVKAKALSALNIEQLCDIYRPADAVEYMENGNVVILAAGTGNPFFTTDSAASLRAIEVRADMLIKATKVDGVYSEDPKKNQKAKFFPKLSYDDVLTNGLGVMDATAVVLCKENNMPVRVVNIYEEKALIRLINGEAVGTLISGA